LSHLLQDGGVTSIDLVLMSEGRPAKRSFRGSSTDTIDNPMEGVSHLKTPGMTSYPGDYNIHDGNLQLQFHVVRPDGTDVVTLALALHFPSDSMALIRCVMRDET
jgi:hypothetical protein